MPTEMDSNAEFQARKRRWILVTGTIVVLAMTYGSGMRSQVKKLQHWTEEYKIVRRDFRVTQLAHRADVALLQQLEARRQLDLARIAVDQRNFGIAQERLAEAIQRLETAQKGGPAALANSDTLLAGLRDANNGTPSAARIGELAAQMDEGLGKVMVRPDALPEVTVPAPTGNDEVNPEHEIRKR